MEKQGKQIELSKQMDQEPICDEDGDQAQHNYRGGEFIFIDHDYTTSTAGGDARPQEIVVAEAVPRAGNCTVDSCVKPSMNPAAATINCDSMDMIVSHTVEIETSEIESKQKTQTQKAHTKYRLLPPCNCKRLKCGLKFTEKHREGILKTYHSSDFTNRRMFLDSHVDVTPTKDCRREDSRRSHSLVFYLPCTSGEKTVVCKTMFLHTLGHKTDGIITEYVRGKVSNNGFVQTVDRRGHIITLEESETQMKIGVHIQSYNPQISHYTRVHAPKRRYLDGSLTISGM